MSKSILAGTGKKRRVDVSFESTIQGGRYESADEILSKTIIPKMEGLSLNLEQMQKRLTKLDRENKLLRKETENLKFKSTYIPTSLKIECPKCNHTMDGPNDFITHLEKVHFYVEQECVIDKTNRPSLQKKVASNSHPEQSFGSPIPEPNRPLRTGRIPKKVKSPEPPNPTPLTRQNNHALTKYQSITTTKSAIRNNSSPHLPIVQNNDTFGHYLRPHCEYHSQKQHVDPLRMPPQPHSGTIPRMRFHSHTNNFDVTTSVTSRHNTSYAYTGTSSMIARSNEVTTSPSQSGTRARARTAAPLVKTSPLLLKSHPSLSRPPAMNDTQTKPNVSPIDLTDSNTVDSKKAQKPLVVPKSVTPTGRVNMSLPIPQLFVSQNANKSVVIKLSLTKEQNVNIVSNYEIKGYQSTENVSPPPPGDWNRIGMVQAMPPPIECTLQRIGNGKRYSFVVRSIDHHGCHGQFSEIHTIQV